MIRKSSSYILFVKLCKNKDVTKRYKWVKSGSTSTAQAHLWKDHKIDNDHLEELETTDGKKIL